MCECCGTRKNVFAYHNYMTGELNIWCEDCKAALDDLARATHEIEKDTPQ